MFIFDGGAPRMIPDHGPDWRLAFFPRAAGEIRIDQPTFMV
jgi:hypothetical protein